MFPTIRWRDASFTVHVGVSGRDSVVSWMLMSKNCDSDRYRKGDDYHSIMIITTMMMMITIMMMMIAMMMTMIAMMMMMITIIMRIITIVMKITNPGDSRVRGSQYRLLQA